MKTRQSNTPKPSKEKPMSIEQREPGWVTEMHEHFQKTGAFRADDLERVLGDPREAVEVNAVSEFHYACFLPKD
jgi:hypothetical protein